MSSTTLALPERRHFAVPAIIVLGALAALLFGFTPVPAGISKPAPKIWTPPDNEVQVAIADVDRGDSNDPSPAAGGPAPVSLPDIPAPISAENTAITVPLAKDPVNTTTGPLTVNPWPGDEKVPGAGPGPTVYDPVALDAPPRAVVQVAPAYPFEAKTSGLTGQVVVEFTVDESGRVHNARAVSASDLIFAEPALRAVEHWRFNPGTRHGVPVRFRMSVPIAFSLN